MLAATLDVHVERAVAGGVMLARHEGRVVLVTGAIPGERVRVRVDRERRDVIHATTVEVLEPDADRRPSVGDPLCGGQAYRHIAYPRQCRLKAEVIRDALTRIGKLHFSSEIPVAPSEERGYRLRARLHLHPAARGLGFLRERSHHVCNSAETGQLSAATDAVVAELGRRIAARAVRSGTEARRIEHIELAENIAATERVVHYQLRRAVPRATLEGWTPETGVTGVTVRVGDESRLRVVRGIPTVSDPVAVVTGDIAAPGSLARRAPSFFQANRYLLPTLVEGVRRRVPSGPVLDLYAGVGLFSIALAGAAHESTIAVERDPDAARDLRRNIEACGHAIRAEVCSVEDYLASAPSPLAETVIVDPPRSGLSRAALDTLVRRRVHRVVYVSCDAATFARDLGRFRDHGYAVDNVAAFDLFPNTAHVEMVATLVGPGVTSGSAPRIP